MTGIKRNQLFRKTHTQHKSQQGEFVGGFQLARSVGLRWLRVAYKGVPAQ